jgi:type IX secretion system substrate protein
MRSKTKNRINFQIENQKHMKKVFHLICFSALLLSASAQTDVVTGHPHKGPNTAVRKYVKDQIMPVLLQKRQQFDHELSVTEKTEIADCRAALKQLESQHHSWKKPDPKTGTSDDTYYGQEHKANPGLEQHKAIMQRLQVIADKHSNSLQQIKTQLEPARQQWLTDIKRLMPAPTPANADQKFDDGNTIRHYPGAEGFLYMHHMGARFLLLPATPISNNAPGQTQGELKGDFPTTGNEAPATTTGLTTFKLMPNPASNDLQLGNDVLPATNVLKMIDMQGKEVMTLENVQAAQHLDVSHLANGTYLVQIKSGDQTVSKKVVISK